MYKSSGNVRQASLFWDLESMLDSNHPLYRLANLVDWNLFERTFTPLYCPNNGRTAKPIRLMNDRRKKVGSLQEQIRSRMAMEMDGGEDYFCIDSKPIEVCRVARGKRCKMGKTGTFENAPDFGYCASQGIHFYGYKLHVLCGLSGVIHSYDLSKASVHDINYIKDIKHTYHDCSIFGDKGYIGAEVQLDLFETANIRLECPYRLNQKDWSQPLYRSLRQERGWRRCFHNFQTSSSSSETMR